MTVENLDSSFITTLDTVPIQNLSAGEGAPGILRSVTDNIAVTASGMSSIGSTYRLCRFPTNAKLKTIIIDLGNVDTGGATAVFDINVAFSDSAYDGTQVALQSAIPTTALNGATTTPAAYSSPNKLFGTLTAGNNATKLNNNVTYGGTVAGWYPGGRDIPLWKFFGFTTGAGYAQDAGGFFDILLYLSTAAATGAAASIGCKIDFVI